MRRVDQPVVGNRRRRGGRGRRAHAEDRAGGWAARGAPPGPERCPSTSTTTRVAPTPCGTRHVAIELLTQPVREHGVLPTSSDSELGVVPKLSPVTETTYPPAVAPWSGETWSTMGRSYWNTAPHLPRAISACAERTQGSLTTVERKQKSMQGSLETATGTQDKIHVQ